VAAIRAARLGLNTAVVESKYWGGVCLNVGCIPSKALLRNAELVHIFTKEAKTFGINGEATFDYGIAYDRSRKVAEGRVAGVHFLMKKNKIAEIHGYGRFTDAHTLSVELNDGGTERCPRRSRSSSRSSASRSSPAPRSSPSPTNRQDTGRFRRSHLCRRVHRRRLDAGNGAGQTAGLGVGDRGDVGGVCLGRGGGAAVRLLLLLLSADASLFDWNHSLLMRVE
jgi:hypothetical protein